MKTLTLIALSFISTAALAVPTGKKVETLLNAPGARELMDEEVQSWKHASEFSIRSAHNDVAVGGSVILRGTPSPAQRFNRGKLISCNVRLIGSGQFAASRNSCDMVHPVYLPLSLPGQDQPTSVAPGYYVLAFENSIYPGFLQ